MLYLVVSFSFSTDIYICDEMVEFFQVPDCVMVNIFPSPIGEMHGAEKIF